MFQCKDLLSLTSMSEATVLAGAGGMERGIRWSYIAENSNFEQWVHGQELLIISGPVAQRKNFNLYQTIEKAIKLNMSCALLLVGDNYVSEIEDEVLKLAERNQFPLLSIPWDVPLLDVSEELGHAISYLDGQKEMQDSLLAEIIFGNHVNMHNIEHKCRQMGYELDVLEQVFIMHIHSITNEQASTYAKCLGQYFKERAYPAIVSSYGDRIIGFMRDSCNNREMITEIFTEFDCSLKKERENLTYTLNIGDKCSRLTELQKSFRDTSKVNSILEHINKQNQIVFHNQMGFYRLLMSYDNLEPMERFVGEVLGEILAYDEKNGTQLLHTLWEFYGCDCNLQKTADKIYLHKNTVKYRLQCIQKLTGRNLYNCFQSMELWNALIIYFYINE